MLSTIPSTQQQHQDRQCCGKQAQVSPKRWVLPSSTQPTSSATAPTCQEPRNVCPEHPVCFGSHTGPGIAPQSCHPQALLLHVGSGKGLGAPGHSKTSRGLITVIPSCWEGEGRVKQSAEGRRGARRQPGYWKPRWAGSDWEGCGEKLRAPTALRPAQRQHCHPWVQPGPATSPTVSPPSTGAARSQSWQPGESPTRGCQRAAWCQAR